MIPRTLSATSLQVAQLCLDRWRAEYMNRAPGFSNAAADVGTSVHGGLELFVKAVYIDKTHVGLDRVKQKELLIAFYNMSYVQTFNTADMDTPEYHDGFKLTMRWFERTNLEEQVEYVESAELKETIMVPYNTVNGTREEVPFNYIMDRVDYLGDDVWRVVDYKTVRVPIQPDDLDQKVQARAYALAVQIKHPEAKVVKVQFDLLRHEPVGLTFTRDDNIAFWKFLCRELQRIVNTPESDVKATLNPECRFCVKQATCKTLLKHQDAGGILSLSVDDMADKYEEINSQLAGLKNLQDKLEEQIMIHAAKTEELNWETPEVEVAVTLSSGRRSVNAKEAADIMGHDLFAEVGSLTVGKVEELIKDPDVDPELRERLKGTLYKNNGSLKLNVKRKKALI